MEDLYLVHEQFWSWTLWPCLEQVPHDDLATITLVSTFSPTY